MQLYQKSSQKPHFKEYTLRPNGVGPTQIDEQFPDAGFHWQKVDEETPDNADYVYVTGMMTPEYKYDAYYIPEETYSGTIGSVTVYIRCKRGSEAGGKAKAAIITHSQVYYGDEITLSDRFNLYSEEWTTNPNTGNAWTWDEVGALKIGVSLKVGGTLMGHWTYCSQIYVVIK